MHIRNKTARTCIITLALYMTYSSESIANPYIKDGKCELIVASRQSLQESQNYLYEEYPDSEYAKIFDGQNGWYAISIGSLWPEERSLILNQWKRTGYIPEDSFCSTGTKFGAAFHPKTGQKLTSYDVEDDAMTAFSIVPETTKPEACYNTAGFCSRLSLAATACGWGVQEAADQGLGFETGATGGLISGVACTGFVNEVAGLDVDIYDLAISAVSSAFLQEAERSYNEGYLADAFVSALLGMSVGAVGVAKCEADLERACR